MAGKAKGSRPTGGLSTKSPSKAPSVGAKPVVSGNRGTAKPGSTQGPNWGSTDKKGGQ